MFWSRRLIPRLAVLAVLGSASVAGTGDLALPDEHFMFGGETSAERVPLPHSALAHDSGPSSDTHPAHTCHCVHAHGQAVLALTEPFRVQVPVRSIVVECTVPLVRAATAPPFHPPKTLS